MMFQWFRRESDEEFIARLRRDQRASKIVRWVMLTVYTVLAIGVLVYFFRFPNGPWQAFSDISPFAPFLAWICFVIGTFFGMLVMSITWFALQKLPMRTVRLLLEYDAKLRELGNHRQTGTGPDPTAD